VVWDEHRSEDPNGERQLAAQNSIFLSGERRKKLYKTGWNC
jgi:hypothetical protein